MKIRWTHDSIRIRITPTELESLTNEDTISEAIRFSDGAAWSVAVVPSNTDTKLAPDDNCVRVLLSTSDRTNLTVPTTEGIYFTTPDGRLRCQIEKDFPCAHPRPSDAAELATETFDAPQSFRDREISQS